jgi:hypothetical protein
MAKQGEEDKKETLVMSLLGIAPPGGGGSRKPKGGGKSVH